MLELTYERYVIPMSHPPVTVGIARIIGWNLVLR
jgi:hypothetical protein